MKALRAVFGSYAVLASLYLVCSLLVKDYGLGGVDRLPKSIIKSDGDGNEEHDA